LNLTLNKPTLLPKGMSCQDAVDFFKTATNIQQLLVTDDEKTHVKGVITSDALLSNLISGAVKGTDCAEKVAIKQFTKVTISITLGKLSRILEKESYAVVLNNDNALVGIVNQNDIFNFIIKVDNAAQSNGIL